MLRVLAWALTSVGGNDVSIGNESNHTVTHDILERNCPHEMYRWPTVSTCGFPLYCAVSPCGKVPQGKYYRLSTYKGVDLIGTWLTLAPLSFHGRMLEWCSNGPTNTICRDKHKIRSVSFRKRTAKFRLVNSPLGRVHPCLSGVCQRHI